MGPKGEKGNPGELGPPGLMGPPGLPGPPVRFFNFFTTIFRKSAVTTFIQPKKYRKTSIHFNLEIDTEINKSKNSNGNCNLPIYVNSFGRSSS